MMLRICITYAITTLWFSINVPIVSNETPLPYPSNMTMTSKDKESAAWLETDAPQYDDSGIVSPVNRNNAIYISK